MSALFPFLGVLPSGATFLLALASLQLLLFLSPLSWGVLLTKLLLELVGMEGLLCGGGEISVFIWDAFSPVEEALNIQNATAVLLLCSTATCR